MLKIDLAKAFDRVEWNFIVHALARKGLHCHFINLIYACISSPTFSIVINGQPFAKFRSDRESDKDVLYHCICLSLQLMSCQLLYRGHDHEFSYRNCSRKKLPAYPLIAIC
jgi:hypothetical protein